MSNESNYFPPEAYPDPSKTWDWFKAIAEADEIAYETMVGLAQPTILPIEERYEEYCKQHGENSVKLQELLNAYRDGEITANTKCFLEYVVLMAIENAMCRPDMREDVLFAAYSLLETYTMRNRVNAG